MTDIAALDAAIAKHAQWKHYLRQTVKTGQSEWTVDSISHDTQCELGRWLALLPQIDKRGEHWSKVQHLHSQLHAAAAEVLALALEGKATEATERLAIGGDFTKISSELIVAISAWKKSIADR